MVYVSQTVSLLLVVIQLSNFIESQNEISPTVESNTDITENYTSSNDNLEKHELTTENNTESGTDWLVNNTNNHSCNDTAKCSRKKDEDISSRILDGDTPESDRRSCWPLSPSLKVHWNVACNDSCSRYNYCCHSRSGEPVKNETYLRYIKGNGGYSNIRMVTSCPSTYTEDGIKGYCESSEVDLAYDLWLLTPVNDSQTEAIYKNVFCAACNERPLNNIRFWNLSLVCYDTKNGGISNLHTAEQDGRFVSRLYPRSVGLWKYRSKTSSTVDKFCFLHPEVNAEKSDDLSCPRDLRRPTTRKNLVPSSVRLANRSKYEDNNSVSQDIGHIDEEPRFRPETTSNPPQTAPHPPQPTTPPPRALTFKLNDDSEPSPRFSGCDDKSLHLANLRDILCTESDGKAKCKLRLVDCVERFYHFENESRFADYESYPINQSHVFVCGPQVDDSTIDTGVASVLNLLLYLLRGALIGLILYLLIFVWLPAKSTLDKSLGSFGFTLIIQIVCAIFERQKVAIPCKIVASIWHYSMLSNFTWMLMLSYDCWLSLRQLFRVYQLVGEYDSLQFLIYFAVSQTIPVLVTIAAFIFGKSSADWYCQKDLGLERYECLLSVVPRFWLFYLIPASFMFGLNIYFLARIGYLVFSRQQYLKEVRQKFKQRSGFALMLSPTWMLGSLLILTHFELPVCDILIVIVHVLQASFFLVYAFDQSLGRIMQKYEDIERNLFGETVYCPMSASVLLTEDRHLLGILEGRQTEQENPNLCSEELR